MQSRRDFVKNISLAGTAVSLLPNADPISTKANYRILFQGDSITDGNRTRNNDWNHVMGHGYAYIASSKLWYDHPNESLQIFNRGISGNTVGDLQKRWQDDTIALEPTILSVLIGINDVYALLNGYGEPITIFEERYSSLLAETTAKIPEIKLILMEPFILPVGQVLKEYDRWREPTLERAAIVKNLAKEFKAVFIPLQSLFDAVLNRAAANYWIWDGIHPMPAGHELIARAWLKAAKPLLPFIK
ncbi:MAG: SGNH/GDSL hydrolase family protein [Chitinophagaceae bacterium]|nr:SGNH/GDSL hydrolase family protein [Chitinophagaceae bacterium]